MPQKKRVRKRGKRARPVAISLRAAAEEPKGRHLTAAQIERLYKPRKQRVTLRLDADVLEWFREPGRRYQTRINRALRKVMTDEKENSGK